MKKSIKKIMAGVAAGMMVLGSLSLSAFAAQDTSALTAGTAYLNINNGDWAEFDAEWTNAEVTADGEYTVKMVAAEAQNLAQFNALEIVDGESVLGTACVVTVDSILINDAEAKVADGYTCSADGKGLVTRVNLYNEWNAPDDTAVAGDDEHLDQRCADGDVMSKSAKMIADSSLEGVTSIEVKFTVSGFGQAAEAAPASDDTTAAEEGAEEDVADPGYNIYFLCQTDKWVYRDSWENTSSGYGSVNFKQVTDNEAIEDSSSEDSIIAAGTGATFEDVLNIAGNGTYYVVVPEWKKGNGESSTWNMLGFSTDIPTAKEVTFDGVCYINGVAKYKTCKMNDADNGSYYVCQFVNQYDDELKDSVITDLPKDGSRIVMEITISGLDEDNAEAVKDESIIKGEAASETTVAPAESGASADTTAAAATEEKKDEKTANATSFFPLPGIPIIGGVVVVVIVVVIVVATSKKKND